MSGDATLVDVLQTFGAATDALDADALEAMIARYPQYAAELTDFAVEWTLQERLPAEPDATPDAAATTTLVARAMRRLEGRLALVEHGVDDPARATIPNPFARRSPRELRAVAARVGIDLTILAKLRDRKIELETVPDRLRRALARALEVPARALVAHLAGPPLVESGARFKAADKPRVDRKETFTEAVGRSLLDADARAAWLADP